MVDFIVEARISLKHGVLDAEGETIEKSLRLLGYPVESVETVRVYRITIQADSKQDALSKASEAAEKLLANTVIQDYELKVDSKGV